MAVGDRIKQRREEKRISSAELARRAGISKGYLHEIENYDVDKPPPKPSAEVVFRIATALGTTVADLLEKDIQPTPPETPPSLRAFAEQHPELPPQDLQMLAAIRFRGAQPSSVDDWSFLYESIKRSIRS